MNETTTYRHGLTATALGPAEWTVEAIKQVRYSVRVTDDLFAPGNHALLDADPERPLRAGDRRLVVIDSNVERIYGARIRAWFDAQGIAAEFVSLHADETVKEFESVQRVIDAMNRFGIDRRREPAIAIGGGVLTDIVGFAASLYRRGTPYVRIPTTLIGLVDAGVGVKTGVNYASGKNRLGTYAPAEVTLLDRTFLASLDARHVSNGLAEILKVALVKSAPLFTLLERQGADVLADRFQGTTAATTSAADQIISAAIHLMLEELQPNLWEACLERCVDYGHTFSPTIEMHALPALLHGEAVGIDMALTSAIGYQRGLLDEAGLHRILRLMRSLGLPTWDDSLADPTLLHTALADTVRHRDGQQRLPLPVGIGGHRFVNDLRPVEIEHALALLSTISEPRAVPALAVA